MLASSSIGCIRSQKNIILSNETLVEPIAFSVQICYHRGMVENEKGMALSPNTENGIIDSAVVETTVIDREKANVLISKIEGQRNHGHINMPLLNDLVKTVSTFSLVEISEHMESFKKDGEVLSRLITNPKLYRQYETPEEGPY